MRHTVVIPSFNTLEHLKNTYESIKRYGGDVDVIIIDDASEDGTADWLESLKDDNLEIIISNERKGHTYWYDEGMRQAKTEIVSILHSDMIIGPSYFDNMIKHMRRGRVVCATRIEPPIHPAGQEKIVRDFGDDAHNFNWDAFEEFVNKEKEAKHHTSTPGIFAPWMVYKEDHFNVGGHDQRFAPYGYEDSDIFNRWIIAGYEMMQSRDSLCYHMTCRGHRWNKGVGIENPDYKETMDRNGREFLRKWGDWIHNDSYQHPIINPKYNKGLVLKNASPLLISSLEPWFSNCYVDVDFKGYIEKEQKRTIKDLSKRLHSIETEVSDSIIVYLDGNNFNSEDGQRIQQLAAIIHQTKPQVGKFQLGNIIIEIKEYNEEVLD